MTDHLVLSSLKSTPQLSAAECIASERISCKVQNKLSKKALQSFASPETTSKVKEKKKRPANANQKTFFSPPHFLFTGPS
jgi:hypothetical protein